MGGKGKGELGGAGRGKGGFKCLGYSIGILPGPPALFSDQLAISHFYSSPEKMSAAHCL